MDESFSKKYTLIFSQKKITNKKLMIMLLSLISKEREKSSNLQFYIELSYLLIINNLTGNNYGEYCFWIRIHQIY